MPRRTLQVWDASSGEGYTSLEPPEGDINDVCVWPDSGLFMVRTGAVARG
jgi:ribosome biogenesis protein ENP2